MMLLPVIVCVWTRTTSAQWTMGSRAVAMGQAHSALPNDAWALFHNPAALDTANRTLGFFAIRYYGLKELEDHAFVLNLPLQHLFSSFGISTALGFGMHTYGFELFRRTQARLGWSARMNRFHLGVAACYVHLGIEGYGSRGSPVFDAGVIGELSGHFHVGYRISHLLHTGNGENEADLHPSEMAGGFSWTGISGLLITADVVKDLIHPVALRAGIEAELPGNLFIRGGWTSRPFTWSAGAGIGLDRMEGNAAVQKHEVLGLSPGIDLTIRI
ncbi:MAG: hypothetical protein R6U28_09420 [Cyclonatronaceae bacterium]